ncbi:glycosyltransferase family 4 protein [Thalassoroseus pseudoceratinae]|uniref:glycosyltransferase family 4 protein n=1 Tax=Thalassoroseus pseudoceratinae TaxID=2713176 RepID=UPI0014229C4E|nr:glycosyltransferase family 4 protein [Thalassoroseus pseudoceratinae]
MHCNEHDIYPFGRVVARLMGVPVVCHVRFRIERGFAQWAFGGRRCPDALMWTSKSQQDACQDAVVGIVSEERQHLVFLGVEPTQFNPQQGVRERIRREWNVLDHEIVIGTASHFEPRKRIPDFIELVRRLRARGLPVRGVYAGEPSIHFPNHASDVQQAHNLSGLGDRLLRLGKVKPIEPFYQGIDVFVSTSEMETFGNSVCEAMAASKPVVAYSGGSVHEVIGPVGQVVADRDLDALTNAVTVLVSHSNLRDEQGRLGRERVEHEFTPQIVAERFQTIHSLVHSYRTSSKSR